MRKDQWQWARDAPKDRELGKDLGIRRGGKPYYHVIIQVYYPFSHDSTDTSELPSSLKRTSQFRKRW